MSQNKIESLPDAELAVAIEYAKFAYMIHCSVTKSQVMWKDLDDVQRSAWIHVIIALRDNSTPPQHVAFNEEANATLRAILQPYAGKAMTEESLEEARSQLYDWVKERVRPELEETEDFDELCSIELIPHDGKLTPRFVGKPGRGEEILRRLFAS